VAEWRNGNTRRIFVWKPLVRELDIKTDLKEMGHEDGIEMNCLGIWTDDAFLFQHYRLVNCLLLGHLVSYLGGCKITHSVIILCTYHVNYSRNIKYVMYEIQHTSLAVN
jgi:hypothetical protein